MIFDLHNDYLTHRQNSEDRTHIHNLCMADVHIIYAIWGTRMSFENVIAMVKNAQGISIAYEDIHYIREDSIDFLVSTSPMYIGLTWNDDNSLAGGAYGVGRLTNKGRRIIERLNQSNIPIDLAHLNYNSACDVLECAKRVICSHTCFNGVFKSQRNLKDDLINEIVSTDGLVGLTFVGAFLGGNEVHNIIKHLDYFVSRFGVDNLAIGTDFFGTEDNVKGIEDYRGFDLLRNRMIKAGYKEIDINKIFYANAARYFGS